MAKMDKVLQYRMDGMVYAMNLVKDKGIEELEKEIKFRNARFIPLELKREKVLKVESDIAERMMATYQTTMYYILHELYGYGKKRITDVHERFMKECQAIETMQPDHSGYYANISDYAKVLLDEYGLDFGICTIEKVEEMVGRR